MRSDDEWDGSDTHASMQSFTGDAVENADAGELVMIANQVQKFRVGASRLTSVDGHSRPNSSNAIESPCRPLVTRWSVGVQEGSVLQPSDRAISQHRKNSFVGKRSGKGPDSVVRRVADTV